MVAATYSLLRANLTWECVSCSRDAGLEEKAKPKDTEDHSLPMEHQQVTRLCPVACGMLCCWAEKEHNRFWVSQHPRASLHFVALKKRKSLLCCCQDSRLLTTCEEPFHLLYSALHPALGSPAQEEHRPAGTSPRRATGTPLPWRQADRVVAIQPWKERVSGRPYRSLPVPKGAYRKAGEEFFCTGI